ncbi:hypothetical protein BCR34DRAFT_592531 [Clohesyomyces aquaticus]|uniref:Uncharacterized protein n=1 Tax=Clohesyomyces aquaticus TaxID=1231657 RepID=A0A1Y1YRD7_9PLEO|nr:hypothetical protein BCR34DRAFT_592531 [Clohesyomyces aquaticus]
MSINFTSPPSQGTQRPRIPIPPESQMPFTSDSHSIVIIICVQAVISTAALVYSTIALRNLSRSRLHLRKRASQSPTKPCNQPLPPPSPPVDSPPVSFERNKFSFKNTTEEPYRPTMALSERLWALIKGPYWETDCGISTPWKRDLCDTARLAAMFLCDPDNKGRCEVPEVEKLLKETTSIADDCLATMERMSMGNPNRCYFTPDVVRHLQLVRSLGGSISVEVGGETRKGVLKSYDIRDLADKENEYMLRIQVEELVDGLPIIDYIVKSREWHQGSYGISFLEAESTWSFVSSERTESSTALVFVVIKAAAIA